MHVIFWLGPRIYQEVKYPFEMNSKGLANAHELTEQNSKFYAELISVTEEQ